MGMDQSSSHATDDRNSGSESGVPEPEFLVVGHIVRPHGIRGEVAMKAITQYPERLLERDILYLGPDYVPYHVEEIRHHSKGMLIRFAKITNRNQAEVLRDLLVYVHIRDAVPLEDGEFYIYQLQGIQVLTSDNSLLGHLTDILETGANDVYIITSPEGKEILIPAIPEVILSIDIEHRVMRVNLLEGLL